MKKKIFLGYILIMVALSVYVAFTHNRDFSEFQEGDLIFHTSHSGQSNAIMMATSSVLTHMGIIHKTPEGFFVIEAGKMVQQMPLEEWIDRGIAGRYAVYRHKDLNPTQARHVVQRAKAYIGTPYDLYFSFDNDALYCSELPHITFKKVGILLGKVQKVSDLNIDNALVEKVIEARWQDHTVCRNKSYKYEQCRMRILDDKLVTPSSIANDPNLEQIYSNYLFF